MMTGPGKEKDEFRLRDEITGMPGGDGMLLSGGKAETAGVVLSPADDVGSREKGGDGGKEEEVGGRVVGAPTETAFAIALED
jgi:hypothetical protein